MADIEVPHPGASDLVARLLSDALSEHPDVQWLGLVSEDGFAIASEGVYSVNDDAVAAGAVRMMIQVRAMAAALGQSGTSQMFLEGGESGICVIDKDPWVLVVVGAQGVPIGLLRYEAREIAEAFPMGKRPALSPVAESPLEPEEPKPSDWAVVATGSATESRADIFGDAGPETVEELEMPSVGTEDFSDWPTPEPAQDAMFDLAPDAPVTVEMPEPGVAGFDDLSDLAPPSGPAIDLPAPTGPAFRLPPPQ